MSTLNFGGVSTDGSMDLQAGESQGFQLDLVSAGSEPALDRRPVEPEKERGKGPDKRLFFDMLNVARAGHRQPAFQMVDSGLNATVFGRKKPCLRMPWLGPGLPTVGRLESLQGLTPVQEAPERTAVRTPFHHQRLLTIRLAQTDDQMRAKAMRRLRDLILAVPGDTQLGRALLDTSGQLTGEDRISAVFADAFRSRATSTLVKRSLDFYRMALWMDSHLGLPPMALTESVVYSYLTHLREANAAPTLADATVKAVWFMHSTANIVDFNPKSFTSRITGVCRDMYMKKRVLRQAPPFPASVVRSLEEYALQADSKKESMFVNFILFCIFSSCRIGDAAKIQEVQFSRHHDVFLVEAATAEAKNTNTKERRRMLLLFTAMGWGLHFNPWCIKWEMQLTDLQPETIMPAVSEVTGDFLARHITTAEANIWLKEVLVRIGLTVSEAAKFSTHSCKATVPTWAGKFGGFSMDERRLLTHHMDGNSMMPLTYSRDNLTALHSRIFRMLTAIRNSEFDPDASNAARIFMENWDLAPRSVESHEWTADWDASESDVSDADNNAGESHFSGCHAMSADLVDGSKLLHHESLVVHLKRDEQTLWCGRKLTQNYRPHREGDPDMAQLLVCQQCDKAQP